MSTPELLTWVAATTCGRIERSPPRSTGDGLNAVDAEIAERAASEDRVEAVIHGLTGDDG